MRRLFSTTKVKMKNRIYIMAILYFVASFAIGFAIDYDYYFNSTENPVANYGIPFYRFEIGYAW